VPASRCDHVIDLNSVSERWLDFNDLRRESGVEITLLLHIPDNGLATFIDQIFVVRTLFKDRDELFQLLFGNIESARLNKREYSRLDLDVDIDGVRRRRVRALGIDPRVQKTELGELRANVADRLIELRGGKCIAGFQLNRVKKLHIRKCFFPSVHLNVAESGFWS